MKWMIDSVRAGLEPHFAKLRSDIEMMLPPVPTIVLVGQQVLTQCPIERDSLVLGSGAIAAGPGVRITCHFANRPPATCTVARPSMCLGFNGALMAVIVLEDWKRIAQ